MLPRQPACFILGGRFGDIIQMLPCFLEVRRRTGKKPVVICSRDYASVLDGVSYVEPHPVDAHWYAGIPKMQEIAKAQYGGGVLMQFWQQPPLHADTIGHGGKNWIVVQCHGHNHGVELSRDPDYGSSMARRAGFSQSEWMNLPLVFDQRDAKREAELARWYMSRHKPVILYNFTGKSSPFGRAAEVLNLMRRLRGVHLVNLGELRAVRIYDVLGLFDRAVGLVTIDTSTMHLAPASQIEYLGFTVDGWTTSRPKGNCTLEIKYSKAQLRMAAIQAWLERIASPLPFGVHCLPDRPVT